MSLLCPLGRSQVQLDSFLLTEGGLKPARRKSGNNNNNNNNNSNNSNNSNNNNNNNFI